MKQPSTMNGPVVILDADPILTNAYVDFVVDTVGYRRLRLCVIGTGDYTIAGLNGFVPAEVAFGGRGLSSLAIADHAESTAWVVHDVDVGGFPYFGARFTNSDAAATCDYTVYAVLYDA